MLRDHEGFSQQLVTIATWSIALAVLVMVMAVSILKGFQHSIEQKIVGFGSHIVVRSQKVGHYYEEEPVDDTRRDRQLIQSIPGVRHVQAMVQKGGMVKTDNQIQGVVAKGLGADYDTAFLHQCLTAGSIPCYSADTTLPASNEIMLSSALAARLHLQLGDKVRTYFWSSDNYRARAFTLTGLFNTDMPELDDHFLICDLRQLQKLNGWTPRQVAGWEVQLDDFGLLNDVADRIYQAVDYDLTLSTIVEDNPSLFAWLDLLNSNIALILAVMAVVCIVAIISALLIMIFEKTQMIGILKTLGATGTDIQKIFIRKALHISLHGIAIGCGTALLISIMQNQWHVMKLDSASYSISYVPVEISAVIYLTIIVGSLLVCLLAMLLPTAYINKIEPARTIRFE